MYANMPPEDWEKYFRQYDRTSFADEVGTKVYGNSMEELYQMFKARMRSEITLNIWGNDPPIKKEMP